MEEGDLVFQKTIWTLQKLPYAAEIETQADEHFRLVSFFCLHKYRIEWVSILFLNSLLVSLFCGLLRATDRSFEGREHAH